MTSKNKKSNKRVALLFMTASTLFGVATVPSMALAQATATTPPAQPDVNAADVVVTARRRSERIQDVPQAISSFSAAKLQDAGITSTSNLSQVAPGLNFVATGGTGQPNIRGVGTTNTSDGDEPNVSLYLDGVYQPDQFADIYQLSDISRLEVLKGPQGSLYGRNATGGAINILTREPTAKFGLEGSVGYGSFNERTATVYVTGALTDHLSANLSAGYDQDDGYVRDILRNTELGALNDGNVRSKFVYDFTPHTRLELGLSYLYDSNDAGTVSQLLDNDSYARAHSLTYTTMPYQTTLTFTPQIKFANYQSYLKFITDINFATFTSQTSTTKTIYHSASDADGTPLPISTTSTRTDSETVQQQFLLNSLPESKIQWVVGLFGYKASSGYQPRISNYTTTTYDVMDTSSIAGFFELTYPLTDRLSVTAGARYTWEKRSIQGQINNGPEQYGQKAWTNTTPHVVLAYKIPELVNLYGSYSEGFKSGVFNTSTLATTPVNPETISAFEVGAKSLLPGPWLGTVSLYHYSYRNIQITAYDPPNLTVLENAARATLYGADADFTWRLPYGLTLNAFGSYEHGKYDSFPNAIIYVPLPQGGNQLVTNVNVSGNDTIRTPEWSGGVGGTYTHPLFNGDLKVATNIYYNGGFAWDVTGRLKQNPYTIVNGSISWTPAAGHYTLTVWAENLGDERYELTAIPSPYGDNGGYAKPRSVGVRVAFKL